MNRVARFALRWWWAALAFWLAATVLLTLAAPPFAEIATFDEGAFLPRDSDAIQGGILLEEEWPDDNFTRTATVALVRDDGELTDRDRAYAQDLVEWLRSEDAPEVLGDVTTHLDEPQLEAALVAEDGQAMLIVIGMESSPFTPRANDAVEALRTHIEEDTTPPQGLEVHVTGSAAVAADQADAIDTSVQRAHLITIVLVVLILLWVFRSPVAPLVPLATIGAAYLTSLAVVSLLAQNFGLDVSSLYETFSVVIVFGAGTDYCLLLVSRYHEELRQAGDRGYERTSELRHRTLVATVGVLGAVIASAATTVIVGFSAQGVAEFGLFRTMGPAMAIAIAVTLLAALTLAPALMKLFGKALFWPDLGGARTHHAPEDQLLIEEEDSVELPAGDHAGASR